MKLSTAIERCKGKERDILVFSIPSLPVGCKS